LGRRRDVAAVVARVDPQMTILVEILRREDVDLERLDAFGDRPVPSAADEAVLIAARLLGDVPELHTRIADAAAPRRAGHVVLVQIREKGRSAPDAFAPRIGNVLSLDGRTEQRGHSQSACAECAVPHTSPPRCLSTPAPALPLGARCFDTRWKRGETRGRARRGI